MFDRLKQRWREDDQLRINHILLAELKLVAAQEGRGETELLNDLIASGLAARRADLSRIRQWESLTAREQDVAALACLDFTNPEIAEQLTISVNTVKTHLKRLLKKFNAHSKDELKLLLINWNFDNWLD